ncbi:MAG: protein kinase [Armatimonadetes bacterium]|nr:protein kinase [Armatimonadota bacterium]
MPETLPAPDADRLALSLFENAGVLPGATGATWLARDGAGGTSVVVKRLFPGAAKARLNETLSLSHPNVVRTRRWLSAGGFIYAVRDIVRGRNLTQALAGVGNKHTAELLEKLLLPVLTALEAAHARGVAHGGVAENNVLIAEDGRVLLSDFALSDPSSKTNAPHYKGAANVAGDIKAMGQLIARHLPTVGAFASGAVRSRVAGILSRCDSLGDLRETLDSLDRLASVPVPQAAVVPPPVVPVWVGPPPLPMDDENETEGTTEPEKRTQTIDESSTNPADWARKKPTPAVPEPRPQISGAKLAWRGTEPDGIQIGTGGGGPATLILTNEGDAPMSVRMVATQRPWLQVRPVELPIRLPGGASVPLEFAIRARDLSPGEYRSEIYLSASAGGNNAEDLRSGWFKHTAEVRVLVRPNPNAPPQKGATDKPPYPANAPTIPAPPGCAVLLTLGAGGLLSAAWLGFRLLNL